MLWVERILGRWAKSQYLWSEIVGHSGVLEGELWICRQFGKDWEWSDGEVQLVEERLGTSEEEEGVIAKPRMWCWLQVWKNK